MNKFGISDLTISQKCFIHSRKEKTKIIDSMFRKQFVGKSVEYYIVRNYKYEKIRVWIDQTTRNNFKAKRHNGYRTEDRCEFNAKQDIVFSGYFLDLIKNPLYRDSYCELKENQNKNHTSDTIWHNFSKPLIFNGYTWKVIISVRETNNNFFLHNIRLERMRPINNRL